MDGERILSEGEWMVTHFAGFTLGIVVLFALHYRFHQSEKRLLLAAAVMAAVVGAWGFFGSAPRVIFADFVRAYYTGGQEVLRGRAAFLEVLGPDVHGFVNLPVMAYFFSPLTLLPKQTAALLFMGLGVGSLVAVWRLLSNMLNMSAFGKALFLFIVLTNGPALYSLKEGNSGQIALLGIIVALICLRRGRPYIAGLLLGLAAITKLPFLLFGLYYAVRGRWAVVAGGATVVGGLAALSLLIFGWDFHLLWYERCIAPYSVNPMPTFNVQSVAVFMARFEVGSWAVEDWRPYDMSPVLDFISNVIVSLIVVSSIAACVLARRREGPPASGSLGETIEFMVVLCVACLSTPLAWAHYFVWMLAPLALFMPGAPLFPTDRLRQAAVAGSVFCLAAIVTPLEPPPSIRWIYVAGMSDFLYATLIMLALLLWARLALAQQNAKRPELQAAV
jgi:hypothetical protein